MERISLYLKNNFKEYYKLFQFYLKEKMFNRKVEHLSIARILLCVDDTTLLLIYIWYFPDASHITTFIFQLAVVLLDKQ
jgi:hypothetical protein